MFGNLRKMMGNVLKPRGGHTEPGAVYSDHLSDPLSCPMPGLNDPLETPTQTPFANGATRGDLAWALGMARPDLGLGSSRAAAIAGAQAQGMFNGRPDDVATRAEAAVMIVRALGVGTELPKGQVAYFGDISESDWYFQSAHTARMYGIFKGGQGDNAFRGDDPISANEARIIVDRAANANVVDPGDQVSGTEPMLEPKPPALSVLDKNVLTPAEIATARDYAKTLPSEQAADVYKQLAAKASYRNQRDNAGTFAKSDATAYGLSNAGDVMCNMTALAMGLTTLGKGVNESEGQMEDQLDAMLYDPVKGTGGSRYTSSGQAKVANAFEVSTERLWPGGFNSGADAKAWFNAQVAPELREGAAATMGIHWGPSAQYAHIVRLEWVESGGLKIDDPYGALVKQAGGHYGYQHNAKDSSEGAGAKGSDNLWSWDQVATVMSQSNRYVQLLKAP